MTDTRTAGYQEGWTAACAAIGKHLMVARARQETGGVMTEEEKIAGRFWSKVAIGDADDCWPWLAGKFANGYGAFSVGGNTIRAHRFAYQSYFGAVPSELVARHTCDNRPCCNPRHIIPGTQIENVADRDVRQRTARGEKCGTTKLTHTQIISIRSDTREQRVIAKNYGVCKSTIGYIKRGETWHHVQ